MKHTQRTDALRNIGRQKVSWLAIVVIAMLSVTAYLGIHFASRAIARNANAFYDETRFRDLEVLSTLLVSPEDMDALRSLEGVADAEGMYQTSGKIQNGRQRETVDVVSLTERISLPYLVEGRLPAAGDECAVEQTVMTSLGLSIGDSIRITDARGEAAAYLLGDSFTVTGVVFHPDHACWPAQAPGPRDVVVRPEAFDLQALDGGFMKALLRLEGAPGDRFSREYEAAVSEAVERLQALRPLREARRSDEVRAKYQEGIEAGQARLDDARSELADARRELEAGWSALADGEEQLSGALSRLSESKQQLDETAQQLQYVRWELSATSARLREAKAELDEAEAQLQSGKAQLDEGKAALEDGWDQLEDAKASFRAKIQSAVESVFPARLSWAGRLSADVDSVSPAASDFWITTDFLYDLSQSPGANVSAFLHSDAITDEMLRAAYVASTGSEEGFEPEAVREDLAAAAAGLTGGSESEHNALASQCAAWDESHSEYLRSLAAYNASLEEYNAGLAEYQDGKRQYQTGIDAWQEASDQLAEKNEEYEKGMATLDESRAALEESRRQLNEGELAYEEGQREIAEGEKQLAEERARAASLEPCRWVILDTAGNASYMTIRNAVENTSAMGMTFAAVFVLVGALVIYATVGRIIEEQRRLVGAAKALGLYNREIFGKYLLFGLSATVLGMLLGVAAGYFGIQRILLYAYGRFYVFGAGQNTFLPGRTAIVLLAGAALAVLAVRSACSQLLRSTATSLMQEKSPSIRHRTTRSAGGRGSLYARLILLNMRSDRKRVAVTVVSVAGCCALLVAGFTMRQSVMKALDAQFDEIARYDMLLRYDPAVSAEAEGELEALLTGAGTDWIPVHSSLQTFSVGGRLLTAKLLCGDLAEMDRFYARLDPREDRALPPDAEGVWIHQRTAETNDLAAGDVIELYDSGMKPCPLPVSGVFRIYAGQEMLLARGAYEKAFGAAPENNAFLLMLNGADAQALTAAAQEVPGVEEITEIAETRATYQSLAGVLNLIALMMVAIAGLMACFILMNLVNMYISQKKRELTIMRINGFTVREVNLYVLRESIVSTALGIALGLGAGSLLGGRVCRLLESASARFMRGIQWETWLWAALITVLYSAVIHVIALRNVKHLKLTDVA